LPSSRGKQDQYGRDNSGDKRFVPASSSDTRWTNVINSEATSKSMHQIFKPVVVLPNQDDINLGEEIAGKISKQALLRQLNNFHQNNQIKELSKERGLDDYLYHQAYISFRKYWYRTGVVPNGDFSNGSVQ